MTDVTFSPTFFTPSKHSLCLLSDQKQKKAGWPATCTRLRAVTPHNTASPTKDMYYSATSKLWYVAASACNNLTRISSRCAAAASSPYASSCTPNKSKYCNRRESRRDPRWRWEKWRKRRDRTSRDAPAESRRMRAARALICCAALAACRSCRCRSKCRPRWRSFRPQPAHL